MSISYSGIVGYGKATLPSVETWGANMNILRDPPKSIQTRKIDKVGESSDITKMIDDSGDRIAENILMYARGVNPMVSVSYSNNSNNGGTRVNNVSTGGGSKNGQSFLPYRVARDGAFRPPTRDIRSLLPLSRQPRVWTSSFTKPGFVDFSKKLFCQGTDKNTQGVRKANEMLRMKVQPRVTYNIQTPIVETYEVKNVIKNPIKVFVDSGRRTIGKVTTYNGDPTKEINYNKLQVNTRLNKNGQKKNIDLSHFNPEQYLQETLHSDVNAQLSQPIQTTSIDELYAMNIGQSTKDQMNLSYTANKIQNKYDITHLDYELEGKQIIYNVDPNKSLNIHRQVVDPVRERVYEQNRPSTSATTNIRQNSGFDDITTREYKLRPTINAGGFVGEASIPTIQREHNILEVDQHKSDMRKKVFEMQQSRGRELVNPYGFSSAESHAQMVSAH